MYIHFDIVCDANTQMKLHLKFRHKVEEWEELGLVSRRILTYHGGGHPPSLYVGLDIPAVKEPAKRELHLSSESIKQIPSRIKQYVDSICGEHHVIWNAIDYVEEMEQAEKRKEDLGETYYDGAPLDEILRYASVGTKIAIEVLRKLERDEQTWRTDRELSDFIAFRLKGELGVDYKWRRRAMHFAFEPLSPYAIDDYLWNPTGDRVLIHIKDVLRQAQEDTG